MRFVDSKRFSPVVHMGDLPAEEDLFHFRSSDIDKSKDGRAEFIEKNNIIIDKEWWQKQYIRCTQGYYVENAIEKGGDAIVDGVDAIWDGDDCYLPQYDLLIRNKTIFIPPRYYFYLNFWLIYGVPEGEHVKQLMKPLFTDMDFLCARRIEMMYLLNCDNQELKSRQKGYEQPNSEKVLTKDGFVNIGNLKIGDKVITRKNTLANIIDIFPQGKKDVYEMELMDGRKIRCGLNHKWKIYSKFSRKKCEEIYTTEYLIKSGLYWNINKSNNKSFKYAIPDIEPIQYEEKILPINPYLLGLLLGDGTINKGCKISSIDEEILSSIKNILGDDYKLMFDQHSNCNYRIVYKDVFDKEQHLKYNICGNLKLNPLIEELKKLDLIKTCTDKFIPEIYKYGSIEQRLEIIRGLMDSDGYISKDGSIEFKNCSSRLSNDLVYILRSLGVNCKINEFVSTKGYKNYFRVYIRTVRFNIFKLKRKAELFNKNKKIYKRTPIINIKKLDYQEESSCILLDDDDHIYLTTDFVPTHNSEKMAGMGTGYNYTFLPASINVIVGGTQGDADHTMSNTIRGLDEFANTQFYLARKKGGDRADYIESAKTKSKVLSLTAKDNAQTVSRYCLAKGTSILMYDGTIKNVENIKLNDELMGIDSTARIVKKLNTGIDTMYRISSTISEDFVCNGAHLLYCHHKPVKRKISLRKNYKWVTNNFIDKDIIKIDDEHFVISAENYFKKSKTFQRYCTLVKANPIEFKEKEILIDPYFLGIWLGDGDSDGLRISSMDIEIENYLLEFTKKNNLFLRKSDMKDPITNNKSKASRYYLSYMDENRKTSKSLLRKNFVKYNLFKNKHIPDVYLHNTIEVRMQLLAGLLDTDGWKSKNGYGFAQVNERLAKQVKWLCESLGFQVNINLRKTNGNINGYIGSPIYDLYIYGYNIESIPVKINRKKQTKYIYRSQFPNRSRFKIEKLGEDEYYGFEIDKDQLFLLGDFTITHNSPTLVIMEEVGKGKKEWSLETAEFIKPSIYAQNGIKTGWIIYIGTGGEMSEGVYDLEQRCYNPKDYNLLTFKNIWTELTTNYGEEVSHFTAAWWMKIMDKNGNTLKAESLEAIEKEYKNTAPDKKYRFKTQSPIFIENVFLSSDAGYFGKDAIMLLNNRYASIVGNKAFQIEKQYVLEFKNPKNPFSGVTFKPKENGWLNIIEEPFKDLEGETYLNLYTSGTDSYDQDEAHTSTSKGAMYIKKGYLPGHAITNNWVAEIIERPTVADGGARTFYLHTAMACIAYSCQNNIEYSNLRIFDFYENNGFSSLLKLRPILAFAGKIQNTKVSNRYGTDKSLKPHILAILRDILSPDVINNMYFTRQIRALSKFIYDPSGKKYNCDITIATAECEVSYKENQGFVAKSRGEKKEEVRKRYERDSNGYIKITYK